MKCKYPATYHVLLQEASLHGFPTLVQKNVRNNFFKSSALMTNISYISLFKIRCE